jgi:hypothetical protein
VDDSASVTVPFGKATPLSSTLSASVARARSVAKANAIAAATVVVNVWSGGMRSPSSKRDFQNVVDPSRTDRDDAESIIGCRGPNNQLTDESFVAW